MGVAVATIKSKKPTKTKGATTPIVEARPLVTTGLDLQPASPAVPRDVLDEILVLQLLVAWAGEGASDPPRLGWWRTSLVDEFGGEDLFRRLTPRTWKWAVLEAARVAARSVDAAARAHATDGDQLRSLFHFGFTLDEQLDDRLAELKRAAPDPIEALPGLARTRSGWEPAQLVAWLSGLAPVTAVASTVGRRLKGELPADPAVAARMLAAAMVPVTPRYPAPHFKVEP
jgi:hypothetical protein